MNNYNPFSLNGKTILITGASSGIGKATAVECSKMGANLIITGRNEVRLNDTYALLAEGQHVKIKSDLTIKNDRITLVNQISKIDGIVYCAGSVKDLLTQFVNDDDVNELFTINTFAPISLIQLLLEKKKFNKKSSVIYVSSISGNYCGYIGGSIYGSSKAAMNGFFKALALEVASKEITVNTINPGMVNTNMLDSTTLSKDQIDEDINRYPTKRYGKPEEIAFAAIYLLSDTARWITGTNLLIDGGYTLK